MLDSNWKRKPVLKPKRWTTRAASQVGLGSVEAGLRAQEAGASGGQKWVCPDVKKMLIRCVRSRNLQWFSHQADVIYQWGMKLPKWTDSEWCRNRSWKHHFQKTIENIRDHGRHWRSATTISICNTFNAVDMSMLKLQRRDREETTGLTSFQLS